MSETEPRTTRRYRMGARAKGAAKTHEKILDAAETVFDSGAIDKFTLAAIGDRAGVAVHTILRHFGSRDGMLAATLLRAGLEMRSHRDAAPTGDTAAAVDSLVDYYDEFGDRIVRLLGESERHPALRAMTDAGRAYQRKWCERVFAAELAELQGVVRERRIAQLDAITGVQTWKLLRRDHGLSTRQTKLAIGELLQPLIEREA